MAKKSSKSSNSNPVTTGYGYADTPGFQAAGIGDDLNDGGAIAAGSGFNVSGKGGATTVNYTNRSANPDVLKAAGKAIGDAFTAFTNAGNERNRAALNLTDDVARGAFQAVDRNNGRAYQAIDRAGERAARLSDDAMHSVNQSAKAAIEAGQQATNDALHFGDNAMKNVGQAYDKSRDSLESVVDMGFGAAADAYDGALESMQANAAATADAFARAAGGQSQETQLTLQKMMYVMGAVVAISAIAVNWK